ncbi:hypothetical protein ACFQL4_26475 [Halosimplex aquaticum]
MSDDEGASRSGAGEGADTTAGAMPSTASRPSASAASTRRR